MYSDPAARHEAMLNEKRVQALATMAQSLGGKGAASVLALTAAAYGSRPVEEATVPTGFDPLACALFEAIVEGGYLVACADGVFDADERRTFESVVVNACGGVVPARAIEALIADLAAQLSEDGADRRIEAIAKQVHRPEHAKEVLRVASLLAQASRDVSPQEQSVLEKLAAAMNLDDADVERSLSDVKRALAASAS